MNDSKFELEWPSHAHHFQNHIRCLLTSGTDSDVTLVCDDQVKLKAHKFILKSCSPVFESILDNMDSSVSRETIYLHGVSHLDMKPILNYMYQGKVSLEKKQMTGFKEVAKNFKIKDIEELELLSDMDVNLPTMTHQTEILMKRKNMENFFALSRRLNKSQTFQNEIKQ